MKEKELVLILHRRASEVRKTTLKMIYEAQSGHPGGSLSAADIMTVLYFHEMNICPQNPDWPDRDRFVLSKGHVCPVLYSCLGLRGFFDKEAFHTLRREGSILQGHPDKKRCPGIDASSGSLGQGFSVAVGMAIAGKRDQKAYRVFTLLGDGETNEGQVWEAAQAAVKYELSNLIVFLDQNGLQNDGPCQVIMPSGNLRNKFEAFGFEAYEINGHDIEQLLAVLDAIRHSETARPKCVICRTVKGKGVSFMENVVEWHSSVLNEQQYRQAIGEIEEGEQ